jgi:hypothetical protein
VVANKHYIEALSMDPSLSGWGEVQFDLAASYGTEPWFEIVKLRLDATRGLLPSVPRTIR